MSNFKEYMEIFNEVMTPQEKQEDEKRKIDQRKKNIKLSKISFTSCKGMLNTILSQAFKYIDFSDIKPEKFKIEKTKLTSSELEELKKTYHKDIFSRRVRDMAGYRFKKNKNDTVYVYILLMENVDHTKGGGTKEEIILKSSFTVDLCVLTIENNQVNKQMYNLSSNDRTIEEPAKFICRRLLYNNIHLI